MKQSLGGAIALVFLVVSVWEPAVGYSDPQGAAASVQLGHCGYFASKHDTGFQPVGASRRFNLFRISFPKPMTEDDIKKVTQDFANAALLARAEESEAPSTTLRFYRWDVPTLSLGNKQDVDKAADTGFCRRNGVAIVRRPTGGAAVPRGPASRSGPAAFSCRGSRIRPGDRQAR